MARLNANGTLDVGFNPTLTGAGVYCVALQANGKILLGGSFTNVGGVPRTNLARLNADGTVDATFNPGANDIVRCLAVQSDGKIILTGNFTTLIGASRNRIGRVRADGSLDTAFTPSANDIVRGSQLQADGRIVMAGVFTAVNGVTRNRIARLENDAATQSLNVPSPARIQWLRGGTSPETQKVTFELSINGGNTWTLAGTGVRISGGWEITGLSMPPSGQIRARARTSGGYGNNSSGIVESISMFNFSPRQFWRHANFDTIDNSGPAADNADPDRDGLENLIEFAFELNPNLPDSAALPSWQLSDDDYALTFTRPANVGGITYVAEYSTSLAPGSWTALPNSSTPPNYSFLAPAVTQRRYLRVRVTVP